jgi:hypothetical protein
VNKVCNFWLCFILDAIIILYPPDSSPLFPTKILLKKNVGPTTNDDGGVYTYVEFNFPDSARKPKPVEWPFVSGGWWKEKKTAVVPPIIRPGRKKAGGE